jgi:hypothetical protein
MELVAPERQAWRFSIGCWSFTVAGWSRSSRFSRPLALGHLLDFLLVRMDQREGIWTALGETGPLIFRGNVLVGNRLPIREGKKGEEEFPGMRLGPFGGKCGLSARSVFRAD